MLRRMILSMIFTPLLAADPLIFGAITTVKPSIVKAQFDPLLTHLQRELNVTIRFDSEPTYALSIRRFIDGGYDFGWIGPSPYVTATREEPEALRLVATLRKHHGTHFYGVIVVRRDSNIVSLQDLKGGRFAFGSPNSTLSYFVPRYMLKKAAVFDTLADKSFLGRHDRVVKHIIMGKSDAGGVKASVAETYTKFVRIIAQSEPLPNFAIVCTRRCSVQHCKQIKKILYAIDDPAILTAIHPDAERFVPRSDAEYTRLRRIMAEVRE